MSKAPIEIYFDFTSPYGYLGTELVEKLAGEVGTTVVFHPYLLGAAFKAAGTQPFMNTPMKGEYAKRDLHRTARQHNIPLVIPDVFALKHVPATRAVYWAMAEAPDMVPALVHSIYRYAFVEDKNFSDPDTVAEIAASVGLDKAAVLSGMQDQAVKDRLREAVDNALERGVFGSPVFFYKDEPFWGIDHLPQLKSWIETGGW